jgi:hypothetical protein
MLDYFFRIQTGIFTNNPDIKIENGGILRPIISLANINSNLFGPEGIVKTRNMNIKGFDDYSLSRAYIRIFKNFEQYNVSPINEICKSKEEVLMVFCHNDAKEITIESIQKFIDGPWPIIGYPNTENLRDYLSFNNSFYNFFWCIDQNPFKTIKLPFDWMVFYSSNKDCFLEAISKDYEIWKQENQKA